MSLRKNGTLVITGLAHPEALTVHLSGADMVLNRKHVKGALFGDCNPAYDIKRMLTLYRAGKLKLDELVTKQYKLSEINDGYADLEPARTSAGSSSTSTESLRDGHRRDGRGSPPEAEILAVALEQGCHTVLEGPPEPASRRCCVASRPPAAVACSSSRATPS